MPGACLCAHYGICIPEQHAMRTLTMCCPPKIGMYKHTSPPPFHQQPSSDQQKMPRSTSGESGLPDALVLSKYPRLGFKGQLSLTELQKYQMYPP